MTTQQTPNSATPRKRAAAKKAAAPRRTTVAEAPALQAAGDSAPEVLRSAFNLDDLEREGVKEPFAFIHNGRQYVLTDPQEQDWQRLILVIQNPIQFLRLVLRPQDVDEFFAQGMPAWKLRKLTEAYQSHFGLGELGESSGLSV